MQKICGHVTMLAWIVSYRIVMLLALTPAFPTTMRQACGSVDQAVTRESSIMPSLPATGLQSVITVLAELGTVVQLLVLALLFFASVMCWGIVLYKARQFRRARRHGARFLQAMDSGHDLAFTAAAARRFAASPLARLFRAAHQRLEMLNEGRVPVVDEEPTAFSVNTLERLRHILRQTRAEEISRFEQGLPFLATTASVAPFVGLFGTVWGIMQSFHAIGQRGGASLAIVGPGISEALVVTAAGLAAAIPAVVAYNHYVHRLRRLDAELETFAEELALLFESLLPHVVQRLNSRTPLQH
jgi:biopolymer transport protein TolQ